MQRLLSHAWQYTRTVPRVAVSHVDAVLRVRVCVHTFYHPQMPAMSSPLVCVCCVASGCRFRGCQSSAPLAPTDWSVCQRGTAVCPSFIGPPQHPTAIECPAGTHVLLHLALLTRCDAGHSIPYFVLHVARCATAWRHGSQVAARTRAFHAAARAAHRHDNMKLREVAFAAHCTIVRCAMCAACPPAVPPSCMLQQQRGWP